MLILSHHPSCREYNIMRFLIRKVLPLLAFILLVAALNRYMDSEQNSMNLHISSSNNKLVEKDHLNTNKDTFRKKLVIVMAYIRGGSSFLGHLLSMNHGVFYWYEPLVDIYNAFSMAPSKTLPLQILYNKDGTPRKISKDEEEFIRKQLWNILSCDFEKLPVEMLSSWTMERSTTFAKFQKCFLRTLKRDIRKVDEMGKPIEEVCQSNVQKDCPQYLGESIKNKCHIFMDATRSLLSGKSHKLTHGSEQIMAKDYAKCLASFVKAKDVCLHHAQNSCQKTRIKTLKMLRLRLESLDNFFLGEKRNNTDVYVIHEVRDPRGIIASRMKENLLTKKDVAQEAKLLCHKMLSDIKSKEQLLKKYPNAFMTLKYEDLAAFPLELTKRTYNHIQEKVPEAIEMWVWENTHYYKDGRPYQLNRINSNATAWAWVKTLSKQTKKVITNQCKDLLVKAGYKL